MGRHIGMPHATRNKRVGLAEASAGARSGNAKAKAEQGSNPINSTKGEREVFKTGPWTQEETERLRRMYPDHEVKDIATALNRPFFATERRAADLHLRKRGPLRLWSDADDDVLRAQYGEGKRPAEIGLYMGRTAKSVCQRLERLGLRRQKDTRPIGYEYTDKKSGLTRRKIAEAPHSRAANWRRVDVIEWEQVNGPVPDGYTLMITNTHLPRTTSNLRLIRKDELWGTITGNLLPPEARELVRLKRQIEREAKKLSQK
ncbi:hypothetical protein D3C72_1524880 [compost metagenome]